MKEARFFYAPDAATSIELPEEEAQHAVRVLRMNSGDEMTLMDGQGTFYKAIITEATKKRCLYRIEETLPQPRQWQPYLHLAVAPTKNMDRIEWLAEKATEIGFDELTFLKCRWSERTAIKTERIEKILISAMKQSRKAWKPRLNEMTEFSAFLKKVQNEKNVPAGNVQKFICHCHNNEHGEKPHLKDIIQSCRDTLILIGPEGDFSSEEVKLALSQGFQGVSLGKSRLRTETAALVAVHLMNLANQ